MNQLGSTPTDLDPAAWSSAVSLIEEFLRFRTALVDTLLRLPPSYRRSLQAQLTDLAALVNPATPDCLCPLIEPEDRPCICCATRAAQGVGEAGATPTAQPPTPNAIQQRTLAAADIIARALAPRPDGGDG